jgi:methylthioribose-1-phosphate isomerase
MQYFVLLDFNYLQLFNVQIGNKYYQSIWLDESNPEIVQVINQQTLPFVFETKELRSVDDVYSAIKDMTIRGAPLIGAAGAFGMYLATLEITAYTNIREHLVNAAKYLISCRPTAVNLAWAVHKVLDKLAGISSSELLAETARMAAIEICDLEKNNSKQIGLHGLKIIEDISKKIQGKRVNILTHCNAGWLACVDYGTATAPVYLAHEKGIPVHVWVDETRPLNQGARLTAFELGNSGVPYTLVTDNTGGHLMQHGMVDIVIVGSDRITRKGDVANKIGTYLKALAANDNNIPFYVALPSSSIDFSISDGLLEIPIEERDPEEVINVSGFANEIIMSVRICPENSVSVNYSFDVTPARLITGFITEKGVCKATEKDLKSLFSDKIN